MTTFVVKMWTDMAYSTIVPTEFAFWDFYLVQYFYILRHIIPLADYAKAGRTLIANNPLYKTRR